MEKERFMVYNAIQCIHCNEILHSTSGHDYITCSCGKTSNDGGNEYQHINGTDIKNLAHYSDEPFEIIREFIFRSGYGKKGAKDYGKFRITFLNKMTNDHLVALLTYCTPENKYLPFYMKEIEYRKENNIHINDEIFRSL